VAERYPIAKVSEEVNWKYHPRNTTVQVSKPYSDPECYNAQHHRWTDRQTDGQIDDSMMPTAIQSAKNQHETHMHISSITQKKRSVNSKLIKPVSTNSPRCQSSQKSPLRQCHIHLVPDQPSGFLSTPSHCTSSDTQPQKSICTDCLTSHSNNSWWLGDVVVRVLDS